MLLQDANCQNSSAVLIRPKQTASCEKVLSVKTSILFLASDVQWLDTFLVSIIIIIIAIRVMELKEDECLPVNDPVHGGHWAPGADCVREEGGTQRTETGDLAESSCSGRR